MNYLLDFELIPDVVPNAQKKLLVREKPLYVCTVLNPEHLQRTKLMIHGDNVMIDDYMHDWTYQDEGLYYYTRGAKNTDPRTLLVVYAIGTSPIKFDPMTGAPV